MDEIGGISEESPLSIIQLREKEDALDEIAGRFRSDFYFYSVSTTASGVLLFYGMFGNWPIISLVVLGLAVGFGWAFRCYKRWQEAKAQLEEVRGRIAYKRVQ